MIVDLHPRLAALFTRVADAHGPAADIVLEDALRAALVAPGERDEGPLLDEALIGPLFRR
jgi:hypothetical protein